jgi:hypothetical protein
MSFFLSFLPSNITICNADSEQDKYIEGLLKTAEEKKLYDTRQWHVLLHYKSSILHGFISDIDDPKFFISSNGKYSPQSELIETIKAFFRTDVKNDDHPICKFIARYQWLKSELDISETLIPKQECVECNKFLNELNPRSAVLIFPTSYLNSPASFYGHTFLRIDSVYESKLISYGVSYAATTNEPPGFFYAFKGIFGLYKGLFSVLPYYEKIKEYNYLENRDIWEYRLNLSQDEVMRMCLHLWELSNVSSSYYFIDNNCSYALLFLIEAARPELNLTGDFIYWVIPIDTIRVLEKNKLITDISYRPSQNKKIKYISSLLSSVHQDMAMTIAQSKIDPEQILTNLDIKMEDKIKILDLASEYLQYDYLKKNISKDDYSRLLLKILTSRSKLDKLQYNIPTPERPETGHNSSRLAIGGGYLNGRFYQNIGFSPAAHFLLDSDKGNIQGSSISFLNTEFRYYYGIDRFYLSELTLLSITSLAEMDNFFKSISWSIKTGLSEEENRQKDFHSIYNLAVGGGITYRFLPDSLLYSLIMVDIKLGSALNDSYSLGAGLQAGVLTNITDFWKAQLQFKTMYYELGDINQLYLIELNQAFYLSTNNALKITASRKKTYDFYIDEINVSWNYYF